MELNKKFELIERQFYENFIKLGEAANQGCNIPYSYYDYDNNSVDVGDGTINIAQYLTFLYYYWKYTNSDSAKYEIQQAIGTLERLEKSAYNMYSVTLPGISFPVKGFFIRDDIDDVNGVTAYKQFYYPNVEDPCFSPFISQDQVWNLNPILAKLAQEGFTEAAHAGRRINGYIVQNGYTIYNPYLSRIVHWHTYCPTFNEDKVKPWERQDDREHNYKPMIKVKRGANNWYYSGGTKACFNSFSTGGFTKAGHSIRELAYRATIFVLDRIYEPIYKLITGNDFKHNSYYCYAATSGIWYNNSYKERVKKRFKRSLESNLKDGSELFEVNIAPIVLDTDNDVRRSLESYLMNVSEPVTTGRVESPLVNLTLYYWWKCITKV